MQRFAISGLCLAASLVVGLSSSAQAQTPQTKLNKEIVIAFYNALERIDEEDMRKYGRSDYIQHHSDAPIGLDGLISYLKSHPRRPCKPIDFVRTIAEGDLVMTLRRIPRPTPTGPKAVMAAVDIFHVQNGKVAEHWDYLETFAMETSAALCTPITQTASSERTSQFEYTLRIGLKKLLLIRGLH
jgi:predicted SnoaL-like aldol condensation-catalyzing enzyme